VSGLAFLSGQLAAVNSHGRPDRYLIEHASLERIGVVPCSPLGFGSGEHRDIAGGQCRRRCTDVTTSTCVLVMGLS
jgi:hypothetical protein